MKKIIRVSIVVLLLNLILSYPSLAAPHLRNSVGAGYKDDRISLAARFELQSGFAFDVGVMVNTSGYSDVNDYSCPHGDYKILDDAYPGMTIGVDALKLINLSPAVVLYGGIGVYFCEEWEIVRSNATGWLYRQNPDSKVAPTYSAGVKFQGEAPRGVSFGYHSIRGANIMLEIRL